MIVPVTIRGVFRSARKTLTLSPGDVLFSEGDVGDEMYGVISGMIELRRGERVVQRVGPDGTFGELAIIDRPLEELLEGTEAQTSCGS